jgi:hypothetical protein
VRRLAAGAVVLVVSAVLAVVVLAAPEHRTRAVAAYLLAFGALAALLAVRGVIRSAPSRRSAFEAALDRSPGRPARLRSLEQVENDCVQGLANPVDLHRRLRPRLREIAAQRLAARHGVDLEGRPEAARALLGEEIWELVRPDRPLPDEVKGTRIDAGRLGRLLDRLEAV